MWVYLDQNKWVDLLLAAAGDERGGRYRDVHDALAEATLTGFAAVPLSSVHLSETWRIKNDRRRRGLAAVMAKFSRRNAIAPITSVLMAEIEQALHRWFGRPESPALPTPFGVGLSFAAGLPDADVGAGTDVLSQREAAFAEFIALAEGDRALALAARSAERHASGRDFADQEELIRQQLHAAGYRKHQKNRVFVTLANQLVEDDLVTALLVNNIPPSDLEILGSDGLAELLADIPPLFAATSLRIKKLDNPNHRWDAHDLNDLKALSVAAVYCDVVVAERSWTHYMRTARLDERLGTRLLSDLRDLAPLLGES